MPMDIRSLNALRKRVKETWDAPGDRPRAIVHVSDEDGDRESVGGAFRTIAAEMGLRHLRFDLKDGLTGEHQAQLARKGNRLVVMTTLDGVPEDRRPALEGQIREGARTLPVCLCFGPAEEVDRLKESGRRIREHDERSARQDAIIAADDARRVRDAGSTYGEGA
jgi:hypothetical protein